MKLFISPHNDDETLFGAFSIMYEEPLVCVVFDSYVQVARGNLRATAERRNHRYPCFCWIIFRLSLGYRCQGSTKQKVFREMWDGCTTK